MRSREMLARLDRLPMSIESESLPDFSLLSPEDYDRAFKIAKNPESFAVEEMVALAARVAKLPKLAPGDEPKGPKIEVPRALEYYWQWHWGTAGWRSYYFWKNFGKVETLRFLELCACYGWEKGLGWSALKKQMAPLEEWSSDDRAEMTEMLDKAATEPDLA
jgi:hypothetical protein